jgi:ADP-heptose:LPS heptosyltransferase
MFSPSFLKSFDSLFGRIAARLLTPPLRQSIPANIAAILIIRPGGIGDAALLAPLITALAKRYPAAVIDVVAEKRNAGVFCLIEGINTLFLYDRPADLRAIFRQKYDLVIDTEQWHRLSAVVSRLTGAPFSIGFATNERSRLFTQTVPYSHDQYEAQSFLNLLQPLGIEINFNPETTFLKVPGEASPEIENLSGKQPETEYVTIFPGASISERLWGTEKFRLLAARFRESGILPVVIGGKADEQAGEEIVAEGGINFAGRTSLAGSAYLLANSRLLVSGDSGILHIAVGVGVPTVSLFGPGIAAKWAPIGDNNVVIDGKMPCSPCTRFGYTPKCPYQVRCMVDISVEDVHMAATALLNKIKFNATIPASIAG